MAENPARPSSARKEYYVTVFNVFENMVNYNDRKLFSDADRAAPEMSRDSSKNQIFRSTKYNFIAKTKRVPYMGKCALNIIIHTLCVKTHTAKNVFMHLNKM